MKAYLTKTNQTIIIHRYAKQNMMNLLIVNNLKDQGNKYPFSCFFLLSYEDDYASNQVNIHQSKWSTYV